MAFFGVRGVGSVYYLGYASGHIELINEAQLWALVAFTVFASMVIHGGTSFIVERVAPPRGEPCRRDRPNSAGGHGTQAVGERGKGFARSGFMSRAGSAALRQEDKTVENDDKTSGSDQKRSTGKQQGSSKK